MAQHPVTGVIYGIRNPQSDSDEIFTRELVTINPATGDTALVGNMAMHMASIAFVPAIVITSITDSGGTLTITWTGAAGPPFSLQTTASLTPPVSWTTIASSLSGPSTTTSATNNLGFFRVVADAVSVFCWTNFAGSLTADGDVDGTGDAARFQGIYGIDINGAGDLLFAADRDAGKIKSITVPGAVVTTLVPSSGSFGSIVELVVNKVNGNIYFPDIGSQTIKKMTYPGLAITTIATGIQAFGLGIDSASDTLYVSGQNKGSVYYITDAGGATPGALTLLAGDGATSGFADGTLAAARFNSPMGIAVQVTGGTTNLYVGDRDNDAIRKIDIGAGMVTTVAGGTGRGCNPGQVAGPHGCFLGPDGNLYVPGQESYTIMKVSLPSGDVTHIGGVCGTAGAANGCGGESLNGNISQVAVDSAGNIYTCDRGGISGSDHARVTKGTPQ